MADLYNTLTRKKEQLPEDQVRDAVLSGTHSFSAKDRINVVAPTGEVGSISATELKDALTQGYEIESKPASAVREFVEENKGLKGAAKVALGKFVDEAALGIPGIIYEKKADPLEVAKWEALKKEHESAKALGSVAGFGASLLVGGPVFKTASTAGKVATEAVAQKLAAAGIEEGSKSFAKDIVAKMATKGVQLGTEGLVASTPRAITEAALGDPEQAGESLLWGVGIGSALGLTGGALSASLKKISEKASEKIAQKTGAKLPGVSGASEAASQKSGVITGEIKPGSTLSDLPESAGIGDAVGAANLPEGQKLTLLQSLKAKKPNADKIEAAHELIGAKDDMLESAVSANDAIRRLDGMLVTSQTPMGWARAEKVGRVYGKAREALQQGIGPTNSFDASELGSLFKEASKARIEPQVQFFNEAYGAIQELTGAIPVNPKSLSRILGNVKKLEQFQFTFDPQTEALFKRFQKMAASKEDFYIDDIKRMSTALGKSIPFTATPELRNAIGEMRSRLSDLEEAWIKKAASQTKTPQAKEKVLSIIGKLREANAGYSEFRQELDRMSGVVGKSRSGTPGEFLDWLEMQDATDLGRKLLKLNKPEAFDRLKQILPEQYEQVIQAKRGMLIDKALKDDQIDLAKALSQIDRLTQDSKGMASHLLSDPLKVEAARTVKEAYSHFPLNPSGTDVRREITEMFSTKNAQAYLLWGGEKAVEGVLLAEQALKRVAQRLDDVPMILQSMGELSKNARPAAIGGISHLFSDSGEDKAQAFKKMAEKLSEVASHPEGFLNRVSSVSQGMAEEGAPQIAQALNQKMIQSLQYLNEQLPRPTTPPNPFYPTEFKPTDAQLAAFERKLSVVMDPFSVLDHLQNGTLTKEHMEALETVYQKLYEQMRSRVFEAVTEKPVKLSYANRVKLSLLMKAPIDPSLQPQALQGYQQAFSQQDAEMAQKNVNLSLSQMSMTDRQKRMK